VGARIRARRKELGLRQRDVSAAIGLTRAQLGLIEAGVSGTRQERLVPLARILRMSVDDLVGVSSFSKGAAELARIHDELPTDADRARLRQYAKAMVSSRKY